MVQETQLQYAVEELTISEAVKKYPEVESSLDGRFIRIPKNIVVKEPIIITDSEAVFILAEENSEAVIFEEIKRDNQKTIIVKEGANITFGTLQEEGTSIKRGSVEKNGNLNWIEANLGGNGNSKTRIVLQEEGAKTKILRLFLGKNSEVLNREVEAIHNAPKTESEIISKEILRDSSMYICKGLTKIKQNASESIGNQKGEALLLSEDAEASFIPSLEIDNHDVNCSHSAAVSQVNKDQIFYLMSRGLSEQEAEQIIVCGFITSFLEKIPVAEIKEKIHKSIRKKI